MKNEAGGVQCRLVLPDGRVVEWVMDGPLVALPPRRVQTGKGKGRKDGR